MPETFQGISFPFQRSTLNRLLGKAGPAMHSSPKEEQMHTHTLFLSS